MSLPRAGAPVRSAARSFAERARALWPIRIHPEFAAALSARGMLEAQPRLPGGAANRLASGCGWSENF